MSCPRSLFFLASLSATAGAAEPWFERVKATATPEQLYTFLYALPKGGDLHNHLQGAILSEWMWDSALAQEQRGYTYYTKVRINNCKDYGTNEFGCQPLSAAVQEYQRRQLPEARRLRKVEYKRLQDLDAREKAAWLNSMRLDQKFEGRDEFFDAHWARIAELLDNPYLIADILYKNMEAFGKEGHGLSGNPVEPRWLCAARRHAHSDATKSRTSFAHAWLPRTPSRPA